MNVISRLFRVILAFVIAIVIGTVTFIILSPIAGDTILSGFYRFMEAMDATSDPIELTVYTVSSMGKLLFLIIVAPIAITGLVGELSKWRSALWYIAGTGLLTTAVPWLMLTEFRSPTSGEMRVSAFLLAVGAVTGLVYWLIAGKSSSSGQTDIQS